MTAAFRWLWLVGEVLSWWRFFLSMYHSLLVQKAGMERVLLPCRTFSAIVNISSSQEGESLMSRLARPLPARTRRQIVEQVAPRYREASFAQKILLLDAVVSVGGGPLRRQRGTISSLELTGLITEGRRRQPPMQKRIHEEL